MSYRRHPATSSPIRFRPHSPPPPLHASPFRAQPSGSQKGVGGAGDRGPGIPPRTLPHTDPHNALIVLRHASWGARIFRQSPGRAALRADFRAYLQVNGLSSYEASHVCTPFPEPPLSFWGLKRVPPPPPECTRGGGHSAKHGSMRSTAGGGPVPTCHGHGRSVQVEGREGISPRDNFVRAKFCDTPKFGAGPLGTGGETQGKQGVTFATAFSALRCKEISRNRRLRWLWPLFQPLLNSKSMALKNTALLQYPQGDK